MAKTYHKLESPTQTAKDARLQETNEQLWGRAPQGSEIPAAQAYTGPLPAGRRGIEFSTEVKPDSGTVPGQANWSRARPGVEIAGDFAKIKKMLKNTQRS